MKRIAVLTFVIFHALLLSACESVQGDAVDDGRTGIQKRNPSGSGY